MWQHYTGDMHQFADGSLSPIAVIDISDQAALVEQVGCMIYACDEAVYGSKETARYVLENLNIIPKRKGARRG